MLFMTKIIQNIQMLEDTTETKREKTDRQIDRLTD